MANEHLNEGPKERLDILNTTLPAQNSSSRTNRMREDIRARVYEQNRRTHREVPKEVDEANNRAYELLQEEYRKQRGIKSIDSDDEAEDDRDYTHEEYDEDYIHGRLGPKVEADRTHHVHGQHEDIFVEAFGGLQGMRREQTEKHRQQTHREVPKEVDEANNRAYELLQEEYRKRKQGKASPTWGPKEKLDEEIYNWGENEPWSDTERISALRQRMAYDREHDQATRKPSNLTPEMEAANEAAYQQLQEEYRKQRGIKSASVAISPFRARRKMLEIMRAKNVHITQRPSGFYDVVNRNKDGVPVTQGRRLYSDYLDAHEYAAELQEQTGQQNTSPIDETGKKAVHIIPVSYNPAHRIVVERGKDGALPIREPEDLEVARTPEQAQNLAREMIQQSGQDPRYTKPVDETGEKAVHIRRLDSPAFNGHTYVTENRWKTGRRQDVPIGQIESYLDFRKEDAEESANQLIQQSGQDPRYTKPVDETNKAYRVRRFRSTIPTNLPTENPNNAEHSLYQISRDAGDIDYTDPAPVHGHSNAMALAQARSVRNARGETIYYPPPPHHGPPERVIDETGVDDKALIRIRRAPQRGADPNNAYNYTAASTGVYHNPTTGVAPEGGRFHHVNVGWAGRFAEGYLESLNQLRPDEFHSISDETQQDHAETAHAIGEGEQSRTKNLRLKYRGVKAVHIYPRRPEDGRYPITERNKAGEPIDIYDDARSPGRQYEIAEMLQQDAGGGPIVDERYRKREEKALIQIRPEQTINPYYTTDKKAPYGRRYQVTVHEDPTPERGQSHDYYQWSVDGARRLARGVQERRAARDELSEIRDHTNEKAIARIESRGRYVDDPANEDNPAARDYNTAIYDNGGELLEGSESQRRLHSEAMDQARRDVQEMNQYPEHHPNRIVDDSKSLVRPSPLRRGKASVRITRHGHQHGDKKRGLGTVYRLTTYNDRGEVVNQDGDYVIKPPMFAVHADANYHQHTTGEQTTVEDHAKSLVRPSPLRRGKAVRITRRFVPGEDKKDPENTYYRLHTPADEDPGSVPYIADTKPQALRIAQRHAEIHNTEVIDEAKALSWLDNNLGGALVLPPAFGVKPSPLRRKKSGVRIRAHPRGQPGYNIEARDTQGRLRGHTERISAGQAVIAGQDMALINRAMEREEYPLNVRLNQEAAHENGKALVTISRHSDGDKKNPLNHHYEIRAHMNPTTEVPEEYWATRPVDFHQEDIARDSAETKVRSLSQLEPTTLRDSTGGKAWTDYPDTPRGMRAANREIVQKTAEDIMREYEEDPPYEALVADDRNSIRHDLDQPWGENGKGMIRIRRDDSEQQPTHRISSHSSQGGRARIDMAARDHGLARRLAETNRGYLEQVFEEPFSLDDRPQSSFAGENGKAIGRVRRNAHAIQNGYPNTLYRAEVQNQYGNWEQYYNSEDYEDAANHIQQAVQNRQRYGGSDQIRADVRPDVNWIGENGKAMPQEMIRTNPVLPRVKPSPFRPEEPQEQIPTLSDVATTLRDRLASTDPITKQDVEPLIANNLVTQMHPQTTMMLMQQLRASTPEYAQHNGVVSLDDFLHTEKEQTQSHAPEVRQHHRALSKENAYPLPHPKQFINDLSSPGFHDKADTAFLQLQRLEADRLEPYVREMFGQTPAGPGGSPDRKNEFLNYIKHELDYYSNASRDSQPKPPMVPQRSSMPQESHPRAQHVRSRPLDRGESSMLFSLILQAHAENRQDSVPSLMDHFDNPEEFRRMLKKVTRKSQNPLT